MRKDLLIKKIKEKAVLDRKNRRDPRFLQTMGFLVAKGFLNANFEVPIAGNRRLKIEDAVWAGTHVEPRILEVLPAAVLRLEKHFDLDEQKHPELFQLIGQLKKRNEAGNPFLDIPYKKLRVWTELPLKDKRVRPIGERKVTKTFRLTPTAIQLLGKYSKEAKKTETAVLESLILSFESN